MTIMQRVFDSAAKNLVNKGRKGAGTKNRAGVLSSTDVGVDLEALFDDLSSRQLSEASIRMSTTVRKATVNNLKRGATADRIGESQKGKMTRGDWRNPTTSSNGYNYLKGGWAGDVLSKRGANKPSMAYNGGLTSSNKGRARKSKIGGEQGDRGIISKYMAQRNGGTKTITGPRYSQDDNDNGVYGYNYAHILEKGGKHVNWGGKNNQNSSPLRARPFLEPAAKSTASQNAALLKSMLRKWGIGK